jgi:hypothetical protein
MIRMASESRTSKFVKSTRWLCAGLALALALVTAGFVLWQNSRVAVLWDLGYLLDTSWRMALGQVPYRDFPLAHAPMTFVVQASLMKIIGRHYLNSVIYAAVMGGVGTIVCWRTIGRLLEGRMAWSGWLALVLTAPLVFVGIYCVYPHPIYDCDCGFWILVAVWLLVEADGRAHVGWVRGLVTGAAAVAPIFFKQNMGLPFAGVVGLGLLVVSLSSWFTTHRKVRDGCGTQKLAEPAFRIFLGMLLAAVVALVVIEATAGAGNYLHWTVEFAASRRLPGLSVMASVYAVPFLIWAVPVMALGWVLLALPAGRRIWVQMIAAVLLAAPFVFTLVMAFINDAAEDRADGVLALWPLVMILAAIGALMELRKGITVVRMVPFAALAAIHGALLSQQLWGSTYGVWPLLLVLIAGWIALLPKVACWVQGAVVTVIAVVLLVCGGVYAVSLDRLDYVQGMDGDEASPVQRATLSTLRGMATRGPYIGNFEELVEFAGRKIPSGDGVLLLPGEDPFYFATGRVPAMPVLLLDPATDPYTAQQLMEEARKRGVKWVIVKKELQIDETPMPEAEETMQFVKGEFNLYKVLKGYEVYRSKSMD